MIHGIQVVDKDQGTLPIPTTNTGVIALLGIAPIGAKDTLTMVYNSKQATEKFGLQLAGFTIPQALDQAFAQKGGPVMVVNVFDPETMTSEVTAEAKTVTGGKFKLTHAPIGAVVVTNAAGSTTYVNGTDYKVDAYGNVTVLATITEGQSVRATYDRLNAAAVTDTIVVGEIDGGNYTGAQVFRTAFAEMGFNPGIIISPTYCEMSAVADEMISLAEDLGSIAMIDAPSGEPDVATVVAERGLSGTYAGFRSTSKNALLFWPYLKRYDTASASVVLTPQSPYWAGIMSANDADPNRGYWWSPSNKEIKGIVGVEYNLAGYFDDPNSDSNVLNGAGICTVIRHNNFRTWGNRSASYPSTTTPDNFVNVQRVKMILANDLRSALIEFNDRPLTLALIDSIRESVNINLRARIQKGALVAGECVFDANDNPPEQLAAGQVVFQINYMPSVVAELITFNAFIDINLLTVLTSE